MHRQPIPENFVGIPWMGIKKSNKCQTKRVDSYRPFLLHNHSKTEIKQLELYADALYLHISLIF